MKAWEVRDGVPVWTSAEPPEPRPDETLIEVAFSGICGSDLAKITKRPVPGPGDGWRPGHEIVGRDRTPGGRGAMSLVDPLIPCGDCACCETGDTHLCPALRRLGWDLPGGFAEYVVAPKANVWALPEGADPAQGVLADALAVAVHGVRCGLRPAGAGRLAVIGSGPLAWCSAAYAVASGWSVTVVVRDPRRSSAVAPHIACRQVLLSEAPVGGFDAVIDAASGRDDLPLRAALSLVRDGGSVLVQNAYDPGVRLGADLRDVFRRSVSLTGSFSYCRRHGAGDFRTAVDLLAARPDWAAPLAGRRYPLGDLPAAVAAVTAGTDPARPLKAVLVPEDPSHG
ncbi:zinc-binding dehydrogenase [Streptomyces sp. NPDC088864]|uniref:zinc-dependent alcohol dehydrogenase n=1 Tax=Streptomyces sp. NPDC088864 TaxID=3365910 RepID=UPI0037F3B4C8